MCLVLQPLLQTVTAAATAVLLAVLCSVSLSSVTQGKVRKMWLKAEWVTGSRFWAKLRHSYTKILKRREGKAETGAKWSHV